MLLLDDVMSELDPSGGNTSLKFLPVYRHSLHLYPYRDYEKIIARREVFNVDSGIIKRKDSNGPSGGDKVVLASGKNVIINLEDVIAIIDLSSTAGLATHEDFIRTAREEGFVIKITGENPKSMIITSRMP